MAKRKQVVRKRKARAVSITVDADLMDALTPVFAEKGVELSTLVGVYLRAYLNSYRKSSFLTLADKLPNGKYFGAVIRDVVVADPGYLRWLVANVNSLSFAEDVLEALEPD